MAKLFNHLLVKTTKGGDKAVIIKAAQKISISVLLISLPVLYVCLLHVPPSNLFHDTTFWFLMSNTIIIIVATDSGFLRPPSTDSNLLYDEYAKHSKARSAAAGLPTPSPIETETLIDVAGENENINSSENELTKTEASASKKSPAYEPLFTLNYVRQDIGINKVENENEEEEEEFDHEEESPGSHESYVQEPLALVVDQNESSVRQRRVPQRSRSEIGKRARTVFEKERPLRRSATEMKNRGGAGDGEVNDQYSSMSDEELNRRVEDFIRRFKQIRLEELRSNV